MLVMLLLWNHVAKENFNREERYCEIVLCPKKSSILTYDSIPPFELSIQGHDVWGVAGSQWNMQKLSHDHFP